MTARQRAGRSEGQAQPGPGDQILSARPNRTSCVPTAHQAKPLFIDAAG
jgi:hypothetical protein